MPTLAEFYSEVSATIARGSFLDSRLPTWLRQALLLHERNNTFNYMRSFYYVVPEPNQSSFALNFDELTPPRRMKAPEFLGLVGEDGVVSPLSKLSGRGSGGQNSLGGWSLLGGKIEFSGPVLGSPGLLLRASFYSDLPSSTSESPSFLQFAEDLYKWQVLMTANARDKLQVAIWQGLRDEALRTVLVASDEEEKETDTFMEYRGGSSGNLIPRGSSFPTSVPGSYLIEGTYGVAGMYLIEDMGVL